MNMFSQNNNLSLLEAKDIVSQLKSGNFGIWKPVKAQSGVVSERFEKISRRLLASMRPPIGCTYLDIFSAIRSYRFSGNLADYVCDNLAFFIISSKVSIHYRILFRGDEGDYLVEICMPASRYEGGVTLSSGSNLSRELKLKLFNLISLEQNLVEGDGFILTSEHLDGVEVTSFRDPSEGGGRIQLKYLDLESALKQFSNRLRSSDLRKDLVNFGIICDVGYMDVDEIIEDSNISNLCFEIANGARFDSFTLSWRRKIPSGWDVREERRTHTPADRPFLDHLGKLSDGQASVDVGILYGSTGYGFSVIGAETIQSESSPILRFFDVANLTA